MKDSAPEMNQIEFSEGPAENPTTSAKMPESRESELLFPLESKPSFGVSLIAAIQHIYRWY